MEYIDSVITFANRKDHFLARWAVNRGGHRVEAGLYALGKPTPESRVFVTANYTLSFDALRLALTGVDAYILVLDTKGINVWCAAGKGTFGTDELVNRIQVSCLQDVVNHHTLILPQLGAPGVSAQEVKQRTGFKVEYGPVRTVDLPEYLRTGQVTPEMRRVKFDLVDRIVLIPVEFVQVLIPLLIVTVILRNAGGVAAILAGTVLFPILLPWLPTPNFSSKGFILGGIVTLPFALLPIFSQVDTTWWVKGGTVLANLLTLPPVTAFLALNFTGATPITSKSGVKNEIYAYGPIMAWMFGAGIILMIFLLALRFTGG